MSVGMLQTIVKRDGWSSSSSMDRIRLQGPDRNSYTAQDVFPGPEAHRIDRLLLIVSSNGLLLVLILSIHAMRHMGLWAVRWVKTDRQPLVHFYGDQDGDATNQSIRRASKRSLRLGIFYLCVIGTAVSGLQTGLTTHHHSEYSAIVGHWAEVGIWVGLLFQCTTLPVCYSSTACFALAWRIGLSGVIALLVLLVRSYTDLLSDNLDTLSIVVIGVAAIVGLAISILCCTVPRCPDVFYKNTIVDRQFTTSILGWISFSWIELVLQKSKHLKKLTIDDLPELDHATRGRMVYQVRKSKIPQGGVKSPWELWWSVLRSHRPALVGQITITSLLSILSFVPQLALLRILTLLEARQLGDSQGPLWAPVVGLGLSVLVSATPETFKYWISYNTLAIRVQQQQSLAVFDKAVRLSRTSDANELEDGGDPSHNAQSPINTVAVDVKNIADLLTFSFLIYESPLKLGIASGFLIYLLGWQSLLAGLVVLVLLPLFNTIAGWNYSRCQGTLMQSRNHRLRPLTEMLQGVRQIKFSAQESSWEDKINRLRDTEMRRQWTVCFWQIVFVSLYLVGPILLSATCLSVYVLLSGSLSAATAFTSISVLSSVEVAMTILPDLISYWLNARVSMRRINSYLAQPERSNRTIPCDIIKFQNATVAWPGCREGIGTLRELDFEFPKDALSIVTGPTGSAKSLLLAAILGETDVLGGTIFAPAAAPFEEIARIPASEAWLIDSALAFVSQTPWLQNAALKGNILLGLPLDEERYAKVIYACALQEDLACLPERDQTEASGKGANLSGGQKWRISLARALYSRARTLLMDDIFSAVDVHTRDHICRHVLEIFYMDAPASWSPIT